MNMAMPAEELDNPETTNETNSSLAILGNATRMLAEVKTIDDAKQLMDIAAAAKLYARKHDLGKEAVAYAHEIEIRAEIKLGEILAVMEKNKGTKGQLIGRGIIGGEQARPPIEIVPTLAEIGITKDLSAESQALAALPAEKKEKVVKGETSKRKAITTAKQEKKKEERQQEIAEKSAAYVPEDSIVLHHADAVEHLKTLADESVDLILIDPPYFQVVNNEWDNIWANIDEYLQWTKKWATESLRVLRPTGSLYIWGSVGERSDAIIRQKLLLDDIGFYFKDWITWKKKRGMGNRRGWLYTREEVLWFVKNNDKFTWNEDAQYSEEKNEFTVGFGGDDCKSEFKRITNVWTDIPEQLTGKTTLHYTPKPITAIERIIKAHTQPGDTVLDFFAGSGTTGIACKNLSRRCILVENDIRSVTEIRGRLNEAEAVAV
jgi:DNA modification methylase